MKTKTNDGWGTCQRCSAQAWVQTIQVQDGSKITTTTCGMCDRMNCKHCKEIDWTGLLKEHCGDEKAFEKPKK